MPSPQTVNKIREPWIDNVKAFAILCVIIGHSGGMLITQPESMKLFGEWIVAFNMPLFVIMAGWTALNGFGRLWSWDSLLVFFEKMFERTVLPSVAVSSLYVIVKGEFFDRKLWIVFFTLVYVFFLIKKYREKIPNKWSAAVRLLMVFILIACSFPINYFWFLIMVIQYQIVGGLISFTLHQFNLSEPLRLGAGLVLFCFVVFAFLPGWSTEFPLYYCLGLIMCRYVRKDGILKFPMWGILPALLLSLVCFYYCRTYIFYGYSISSLFETGLVRFFFVRQITGVIISIIVIRMVIQYSENYNAISRFGSFSMALYMLHTQIVAICPITFEGNATHFCWINLLLIVCGWAGISYGLILLLNAWMPTRKLFLGKN